jgi:hypothetical protein
VVRAVLVLITPLGPLLYTLGRQDLLRPFSCFAPDLPKISPGQAEYHPEWPTRRRPRSTPSQQTHILDSSRIPRSLAHPHLAGLGHVRQARVAMSSSRAPAARPYSAAQSPCRRGLQIFRISHRCGFSESPAKTSAIVLRPVPTSSSLVGLHCVRCLLGEPLHPLHRGGRDAAQLGYLLRCLGRLLGWTRPRVFHGHSVNKLSCSPIVIGQLAHAHSHESYTAPSCPMTGGCWPTLGCQPSRDNRRFAPFLRQPWTPETRYSPPSAGAARHSVSIVQMVAQLGAGGESG